MPIVAFILPNLFKRYSIQKHIDKRAKLVLNADLEKNAFIFNERPYDVKCVFQIYMHKNIALNLKDERIIAPPKSAIMTSSLIFTTTRHTPLNISTKKNTNGILRW